MRKGDILAIAFVTLVTFPVLYVVMLFATGSLRLEYGFKEADGVNAAKVEEVRSNARRDSLAAQNSKIFLAVEQERADLIKEHERLAERYSRLEMFQAEIEKQREELAREREELVKEQVKFDGKRAVSSEAEDARYRKLAKIYEAMKSAEAAGVLETLPDAQVAGILMKMNDDRQKGKILSALSKDKAARVNKLIK